ncbi:uncharacterized protein LOC103130057 isoform X2 [Poecilia formosa]|uniref:uncharacterized protein LOC103130057 isoform X2 n=1 Tax=Poecilia formosa TaxID=48698 RepID=UPI000443A5C9|nr:PREDICTED: uncharacterized protein LOC103130057 isoform X2 [Poecilia formosa]
MQSPWEAAEFNLSSHLQLVLEGVDYGFKQQLIFFSAPECLLTSISSCPLAVLVKNSPPRIPCESVLPLLWITYLLCPPSTLSVLPVRRHSSCAHLFPSSIPLRWIPLRKRPGQVAQARTQPEKEYIEPQSEPSRQRYIPVRSPTKSPAQVAAQVFIPFLPSKKDPGLFLKDSHLTVLTLLLLLAVRRPGHQLQYSLPDPSPGFNKTYYCALYRSLLLVFLHVGL